MIRILSARLGMIVYRQEIEPVGVRRWLDAPGSVSRIARNPRKEALVG
jgi:hypothetical protein